jgi:aminopeptidase N
LTNFVEEKSSQLPNYRWWVPVSLTDSIAQNFSQSNTRPAIWLTPNEISATTFIGKNEDSWIIANILASGYYRVNYDERNWKLLDLQLKTDHQVIHPINRAYLIDDSFALAAAEILPYTTAFSLIEYLPKENHHVPWSSAIKALNYIGRMFSYTKNYGRYKVNFQSIQFFLFLYFLTALLFKKLLSSGFHALTSRSDIHPLRN